MENVALWHERDISHSSVERMIGPDATVTLDFALARLTGLVDKLVVYPGDHAEEPRPPRRPRPLAAGAAGADPGGRLAGGRLPSRPAQRCQGVGGRTTSCALLADPDVAALPPETIRALFDLGYHLKHVDTIFARVFGDG